MRATLPTRVHERGPSGNGSARATRHCDLRLNSALAAGSQLSTEMLCTAWRKMKIRSVFVWLFAGMTKKPEVAPL